MKSMALYYHWGKYIVEDIVPICGENEKKLNCKNKDENTGEYLCDLGSKEENIYMIVTMKQEIDGSTTQPVNTCV